MDFYGVMLIQRDNTELSSERSLKPFWMKDVIGIRLLNYTVPTVLVTTSCEKLVIPFGNEDTAEEFIKDTIEEESLNLYEVLVMRYSEFDALYNRMINDDVYAKKDIQYITNMNEEGYHDNRNS